MATQMQNDNQQPIPTQNSVGSNQRTEITHKDALIEELKLTKLISEVFKKDIQKNSVSILWKDSQSKTEGRGSGLLISRDLILSCAHLMYHNMKRVDDSLFQIYPTQSSLLVNPYRIERVYSSQEFKKTLENMPIYFDFALIKLSEKVPVNEFITLSGVSDKLKDQLLQRQAQLESPSCKQEKVNVKLAEHQDLSVENLQLLVKRYFEQIQDTDQVCRAKQQLVFQCECRRYSAAETSQNSTSEKIEGEIVQLSSAEKLKPELLTNLEEVQELGEKQDEMFTTLDEEGDSEQEVVLIQKPHVAIQLLIAQNTHHLKLIKKSHQNYSLRLSESKENQTFPINFQQQSLRLNGELKKVLTQLKQKDEKLSRVKKQNGYLRDEIRKSNLQLQNQMQKVSKLSLQKWKLQMNVYKSSEWNYSQEMKAIELLKENSQAELKKLSKQKEKQGDKLRNVIQRQQKLIKIIKQFMIEIKVGSKQTQFHNLVG